MIEKTTDPRTTYAIKIVKACRFVGLWPYKLTSTLPMYNFRVSPIFPIKNPKSGIDVKAYRTQKILPPDVVG